MAEVPWVLVWDLDLTLGRFDELALAQGTDAEVSVQVRSGLEEALGRLSGQGFVHTILTVATPAYAEAALRGIGLRAYFHEVAGRGQRAKGDAAGIASAMGLATTERAAKMLFVGDHPIYDPPSDTDVIFHLEPRALERSAAWVADLALALRERGSGSLRRGFDAVWSEGPAPAYSMVATRSVPGLPRLALRCTDAEAPVVAFDDGEALDAPAEDVSFVPDRDVRLNARSLT